MRARLHRDAVTLRELLGEEPGFEILAAALAHGFSARLGLEPEPATGVPCASSGARGSLSRL